jgi:ribosomal protein S18 acetylase RimI-like enzyme
MRVRLATSIDLLVLEQFDELHDVTSETIAAHEIFIAADESNTPRAYARFNYTFFSHGWIATLVTHPAHRRRGLASALLYHLESQCTTPKIFISTNSQNLPMHALLAKHRYTQTGQIENLAPIPELIYFKILRNPPNF